MAEVNQEASARQMMIAVANQEAAAQTALLASPVTFYSRIDGMTHVFSDGSKAIFAGGMYITNREWEARQLAALCNLRDQHLIYPEQVEVQNKHNDMIIAREVGSTPPANNGGVQTQGVRGMVNSGALAGLDALTKKS